MKKYLLLACVFCLALLSFNAQTLNSSIADSIMANSYNLPYIHADTAYLPDGNGIMYSLSITHTNFGSGDTIQSGSDIFSICTNIEHSYMGDLTIELECPNGTKIMLADNYGGSGGGTFLGDALDDNGIGQGIGMNYCFSENALWGTMVDEHQNSNWIPSTVTPGNNILTSGLFSIDGYMDSLIGCPLNGDWSINITDNMSIDNGYIFNWQINFDTLLFPAGFNMGSARVLATGGVPPYTYFWSNGATTESALRLAPGVYEVIVTDSDTSGGNYNKAIGAIGNRTSSTVTITENTLTTIDVNLDEGFSIYPNPAQGKFVVSVSKTEKLRTIKLFNSLGILVKEENNLKNNKAQIDIENLPNGIYIVVIDTDKQKITQKIVKE